jgi:hypothetical protein
LNLLLKNLGLTSLTPTQTSYVIQALAQILKLKTTYFVTKDVTVTPSGPPGGGGGGGPVAPVPAGGGKRRLQSISDIAILFGVTVPIFEYPIYSGNWRQMATDFESILNQAIADGSFMNALVAIANANGDTSFNMGTIEPNGATISDIINGPHYTAGPTAIPTAAPSAAPTFNANEVNSFFCAPYTAVNTHNTTVGYKTCTFLACNGFHVTASTCALDTFGMADCQGDTLLQVYDSSGSFVATNNNYCGRCAAVSFVVSDNCQKYTIREGCFGDGSCGGTVAVSTFIP